MITPRQMSSGIDGCSDCQESKGDSSHKESSQTPGVTLKDLRVVIAMFCSRRKYIFNTVKVDRISWDIYPNLTHH